MAKKEEIKEEKKGVEIEVGNPEDFRPKVLPLVVKPKGGEWANKAQEEYAKVLNAYAYANGDKWEVKKDVLLKNLAELEKNPGLLHKFQGGSQEKGKLSYKNKLHEE